MHATTRSFAEVQGMLSEMRDAEIQLSTKASLAVIKAAIQSNSFKEALQQFSAMKATWDARSDAATAWPMPRHVMQQLVEFACKERCVAEFIDHLKGLPVPEEAINAMLCACNGNDDAELLRKVETLARECQTPLADSTYSLLIKGLESRPWRVKAIVQEVLEREHAEFSQGLVVTVLHVCKQSADKSLADTLLDKMKSAQLAALSAFINFYAETQQFEKACDVFEFRVMPSAEGETQERIRIDDRVERALMSAALTCGRNALVQKLFDPSRADIGKHVLMIRKCAGEKNLVGAMSIFKSLKEAGAELNSIVYNTVLDACVKCNDLKAAETWWKQAKEAGMVDAVSFNTLMKAHLVNGNFDKARAVMKDMSSSGFEPTRVTYNELINAVVSQGGRKSEMWEIVKEMKAANVPPNQVTCSILLKTLNAKSADMDVNLTMDLIENLEEPMDEVLLSSLVEACVRIGKADLVAAKLRFLESKEKIVLNGSHTCGSLIKAYGYARDMEGVWRCWKEMKSRHVQPTSITVGCMVEAIVNNGDTDAAFELVVQMRKENAAEGVVNSVIYCSILKGFAREKKLDRVWDVYQFMCTKRMEMSLITFNTIVDACARSGRMDHLPKIMQDMKKHHVDANIVTYSTIIKGYCQAGDMPTAFSILAKMKAETNFKPDEIMYNSMLDGCSHNDLFEEGLALLEKMLEDEIVPSNFTLSIMVRLLNRAHKTEKAFELVQSITQKYKFRPNVHVYTSLIQACVGSRQLARCLTVLQDMVNDWVQPDGRVYVVLVRAFNNNGQHEQASKLLRAALGLPGAIEVAGLKPCRDIEHWFVNEVLGSLPESMSSALIADIKQKGLKINIAPTPAKGKGKGKGKGKW